MAMDLTLGTLEDKVMSGDIDTVIVADTDMQGRLYGKRLSARHFLDVGRHGVATCSVVSDGARIIRWIRATVSPDGRPATRTCFRFPCRQR